MATVYNLYFIGKDINIGENLSVLSQIAAGRGGNLELDPRFGNLERALAYLTERGHIERVLEFIYCFTNAAYAKVAREYDSGKAYQVQSLCEKNYRINARIEALGKAGYAVEYVKVSGRVGNIFHDGKKVYMQISAAEQTGKYKKHAYCAVLEVAPYIPYDERPSFGK